MTGSSALPKQTDFSLTKHQAIKVRRIALKSPAASLGNTAYSILYAAVPVQPQMLHFSNESCFKAHRTGKYTYSVETEAPFQTKPKSSWQILTANPTQTAAPPLPRALEMSFVSKTKMLIPCNLGTEHTKTERQYISWCKHNSKLNTHAF